MSDDNKLFKVAGVSCGVTGFKVRFANDMTRVKVLMKSGNSDIELIELPHEMSKSQAVDKVSKPASVKVAKQKKSAPSIEDIRARARASSAPADMLGEAIAALVAESQRNPVTE